jgi:hypothetical protein
MTAKKEPVAAPSLKQEQVALLKFEKQLAGLAAAGGALGLTAATAAEKLGGDVVSNEQLSSWRESLLDLAAKTQDIHSAFETAAQTMGAQIVSGGDGKDPPVQVIASILGLS